jgi:hypothetical protein
MVEHHKGLHEPLSARTRRQPLRVLVKEKVGGEGTGVRARERTSHWRWET